MNKQVIFVMLGALIVSVLVAVIVQSKLSPKSDGVPSVQILVASKKLSVGTEVTADVTKWKKWPKGSVFTGSIVKSKQEDPENLTIYGKLLRRNLDSGEPITKTSIVKVGKKGGNFLAASLAPGMRASSFSVSASTSVGGFVRPGDFVDIILTYSVRLARNAQDQSRSTVQKYASQTILENVKVLAVDQITKEGDRKAKIGRTVTVEVDKAGVETLALARTMGKMSLALRGLGDVEAVDKKGLTTDVSLSKVLQKLNAIQDRASVNTNTVRVYSGTDVQNMSVRSVQK